MIINKLKSITFKNTKEFAELLAAIATFCAFCFAIYAYNFSSLPEEILNKLNSEIASKNEDLIDLKKKRRTAEDELVRIKASLKNKEQELNSAIKEKTKTMVELEALREEILVTAKRLDQLRKDNKNLKTSNATYLAKSIHHIFGSTFTDDISESISDYRIKAHMAKDFKSFLKAQESKNEIDTETYVSMIPSSWLDVVSAKYLRDAPPYINFYLDEENLTLAFLNHINSNPNDVSGLKFLQDKIDSRLKSAGKDVSEEDLKRIRSTIADFLDQRKEHLDGQINLHHHSETSPEDIVLYGKTVSFRIGQVEKAAQDLKSYLSDKINNHCTPKNNQPFQFVPVILVAIFDRLANFCP